MNGTLTDIAAWLSASLENVLRYFSQPWAFYQIGIIAAALVAGHFLGRIIEERLEARARSFKGHAGLLRLIIAFLRRTEWLIFIAILWFARLVMVSLTWQSRSHLIAIVLSLSTAWLIIAVLTRIIRNRTLARTIAVVIWCYVAVQVLNIQEPVAGAMDQMAINIGSFHLSALSALKIVVVTTILFSLAVFVGNFVENRIARTEDLSPSLKVLLTKIAKITLIGVAAAIALTATGIDLTALTVFSGAIGVGIGFGLQKVVSNFISGIIILMDKSIKPGDTIELGDTFGWIRELRARFVSVITRDGREYLIPNEDLIAQRVVNWSFSNEFVRLDVDFGVSYDSDPHEVTRLAIEAARGVPRVLSHQDPVCWMTAFGASSLDFKLRFWISDPQSGLTNIRGQVLLALWDAFKEANVKIPFPHREILLRTPVEIVRTPAPGPNPDGDPASGS